MQLISLKRRIYNKITHPLDDKRYFQLLFLLRMKIFPNLARPKTLNEKVIWRILYDRNDLFTRLTDKARMREYVQELGLGNHLPKTYFIGANPDDIPFDTLPTSFVIKPNHASGQIIFVQDNMSIEREKIVNMCRKWLAFNYYEKGREWPYKNILPQVIVEELLDDFQKIRTYKYFCFHGTPKLVLVQEGYDSKNSRFGAYDMNWQKQQLAGGPQQNVSFTEPQGHSDMQRLAKKISAPFDFVRVDLYDAKNKLSIGELTFTPSNGMDTYWQALDAKLGAFWNLEK